MTALALLVNRGSTVVPSTIVAKASRLRVESDARMLDVTGSSHREYTNGLNPSHGIQAAACSRPSRSRETHLRGHQKPTS